MEQQPGQDPEHDGPSDPQPGHGSPGPADAGFPGAAASPGAPAPAPRFRPPALPLRFRQAPMPMPLPVPMLGPVPWRRERFRPVDAAGGRARGGEEAGGTARRVRHSRRLGPAPPGPDLAAAVRAAGPDWRCAAATGEELIGMLRAMTALQSWAAAGSWG